MFLHSTKLSIWWEISSEILRNWPVPEQNKYKRVLKCFISLPLVSSYLSELTKIAKYTYGN